MATFEIEHEGKTYDVEAPDAQAAYDGFAGAMGLNSQAQSAPAASKEKTGGFGRALLHGASTSAYGVGATVEQMGGKTVGPALKRLSKTLAPENYEVAGEKFKFTDPSTYGYVPRALVEGLPRLAADAVGGAVLGPAGFMATDAAQTFGNHMEARKANNGGKELTTPDYVIGGASSLTEGALNRLGISRAASALPKGAGVQAIAQSAKQTVRAGGENAALGAGTNAVSQAADLAGTDKGIAALDPEQVANSGVLQGATGAAVRGAKVPGDVINATRQRGFDPAIAGRVVDRADSLGLTFVNPKESGANLTRLNDHYKEIVSNAIGELKTQIRAAGDELSARANDALDSAVSSLNKGDVLKGSELPTLRQELSGKAEGQKVIDLLDERQTWNKAASRGRVMDNGKWAGGLTSTRLAEALNPMAWLRSKYSAAAGGLAGVAGLGAGAQAAALGMMTAKGIAGLSTAHGVAMLGDQALGLRNPGAEFVNRFRGLSKYNDLSGRESYAKDAANNTAHAEALREDAAFTTQMRREATAEDQRFNARKAADDKVLNEAIKANSAFDKATRRDAERENARRTAQAKADGALETEAFAENAARDAALRKEATAENTRRTTQDVQARKASEALEKLAWAENRKVDQQAAGEAVRTRREASRMNDEFNAKASETKRLEAAKAKLGAKAEQAFEKFVTPQVTPTITSGLSKTAKALRKAQNAQEKLQAVKGAPKGSKASQDAPKPTEATSGETIVIRHNGQEVVRPAEGIKNRKAYVTKTKTRMEDREAFANDLKKVAGKDSPIPEALLTKLNSTVRSWKDAMGEISELVNELPEAKLTAAWDVVAKHEARIRGTYGES